MEIKKLSYPSFVTDEEMYDSIEVAPGVYVPRTVAALLKLLREKVSDARTDAQTPEPTEP